MITEDQADEITLAESVSFSLGLMRRLAYHNLIVTEIDTHNRKNEVLETISTENRRMLTDGDSLYDYVIIDQINSPADIFSTFQKHNSKLIIFDTEKILSRKEYLDVLEGGVCSSPDSTGKWKVHYKQEKPFSFTGHAIILTSKSKKDLFKNKEKYKYLLRDLAIL